MKNKLKIGEPVCVIRGVDVGPEASAIIMELSKKLETTTSERDAFNAQNEAFATEVKALRAQLAKEAEDAVFCKQQLEMLKGAVVSSRQALLASVRVSDELRRMML